jgi:hypothetical protein
MSEDEYKDQKLVVQSQVSICLILARPNPAKERSWPDQTLFGGSCWHHVQDRRPLHAVERGHVDERTFIEVWTSLHLDIMSMSVTPYMI